MSCPNSNLILDLLNLEDETHRRIHARCKQWGCEYCGRINAGNLADLVHGVVSAYMAKQDLTNPKLRYSAKLVTLTLPGDEWRSTHTLEDAEVLSKKALKSFLEALRRDFNVKHYIWVREDQAGGWPHFHVLVMGPGIADKSFLGWVDRKWKALGMGRSEVAIPRTLRGTCGYLTKYISKSSQKTGAAKKGYRTWSMSKDLRHLVKEENDFQSEKYQVVAVYQKNSDGTLGSLLWEVQSHTDLSLILSESGHGKESKNFKKKKSKNLQYTFWDDLPSLPIFP